MVSLTIIYLYFYYIVHSQTVDCKSPAMKGSVKSRSRKHYHFELPTKGLRSKRRFFPVSFQVVREPLPFEHYHLSVEVLFGKLLVLYTLTHIIVIKSSETSQRDKCQLTLYHWASCSKPV